MWCGTQSKTLLSEMVSFYATLIIVFVVCLICYLQNESNIVSVNADGSDTQNNHEIMEDWDSEEEDSDSGAPPRIPSRGKNRKVTAVNQNENDDDPPPAPSARPATLSGLKGKRKSVLSTLIDQNKSNKSNKSNNTSQNHSNTIKNASPTRGKSSTNNNGDLAKALKMM